MFATALWFLLRYPYSRLMVAASAQVLSVLGGPPADGMFVVQDSRFYLAVHGLGDSPDEEILQERKVYRGHWNAIPFLTLLFATPLGLLRRRAASFAVAAALLWACHVFFFVLSTLWGLDLVFQSHGQDFLGGTAEAVLVAATNIYGTLLAPVLPLLLYGLALVSSLRARQDPGSRGPARQGAVVAGRNDPCPCGSRRKFKRCCGR